VNEIKLRVLIKIENLNEFFIAHFLIELSSPISVQSVFNISPDRSPLKKIKTIVKIT
jgi:hypothetical protein